MFFQNRVCFLDSIRIDRKLHRQCPHRWKLLPLAHHARCDQTLYMFYDLLIDWLSALTVNHDHDIIPAFFSYSTMPLAFLLRGARHASHDIFFCAHLMYYSVLVLTIHSEYNISPLRIQGTYENIKNVKFYSFICSSSLTIPATCAISDTSVYSWQECT